MIKFKRLLAVALTGAMVISAVPVQTQAASKLKLSYTTKIVTAGKSFTITIKGYKKGTYCSGQSNNDTVASVITSEKYDCTGKIGIIGVSPGKAVVSVKTTGKTLKCNVYVKKTAKKTLAVGKKTSFTVYGVKKSQVTVKAGKSVSIAKKTSGKNTIVTVTAKKVGSSAVRACVDGKTVYTLNTIVKKTVKPATTEEEETTEATTEESTEEPTTEDTSKIPDSEYPFIDANGAYKWAGVTVESTLGWHDALSKAQALYPERTVAVYYDSKRVAYKTIYHPAVEAYDETVNRTLHITGFYCRTDDTVYLGNRAYLLYSTKEECDAAYDKAIALLDAGASYSYEKAPGTNGATCGMYVYYTEVIHHDAVASWTETTNEVEATYYTYKIKIYK